MELEGIFSLIKRVHNIFFPQNILGERGGQCFISGSFAGTIFPSK